MKKFLSILFILTLSLGYSQTKRKPLPKRAAPVVDTLANGPVTVLNEILPTTLDEYNYMTKGYRIEHESGLDPKSGYTTHSVPTVGDGLYTFDFMVLKRSNNDVAGIICKAVSKSWGNTYYLGIPVNNPDLFAKYYADLDKWDKAMIQSYAKYSSILFGAVTAALYQQK